MLGSSVLRFIRDVDCSGTRQEFRLPWKTKVLTTSATVIIAINDWQMLFRWNPFFRYGKEVEFSLPECR